jgi:NADPH:quinone reductase-like Zn-dependent oxidoreductase
LRSTRRRSPIAALNAVASGHLKPIIANTFPLEKIVEATQYLESNRQFGKIVVTVPE